jgi:hypothetical protein
VQSTGVEGPNGNKGPAESAGPFFMMYEASSMLTRVLVAFFEAIRDCWFVALGMAVAIHLLHFPALHAWVAYLMVLISVACGRLPEYRVKIEWIVGVTGILVATALWTFRGYTNAEEAKGVALIVGGTCLALRVHSSYVGYRERANRVRLPDEP